VKISIYCMFLVLGVALPAWLQSAPMAQQMQEPAWPLAFDVQGPQVHTYGFAVTQPGPIVVSVQAQGAPLSLSVQGPLPNPSPPMVQSGAGSLRINYTVTPQDLQRGIFWQFQVRLAQAVPPQAAGRANGSITVQHPPVDQARVQQAMQALLANRHQPAPAARAEAIAQARSQREADLNAHKAQLAQRRVQNHAAILAQLQPMLNEMRRQKALLQQSDTASPPGSNQIKSRAVAPLLQLKRLPLPPPHITGFTVAHEQDPINLPPGSAPYGQPGDAVTITGTGFGNSDGELHFVIGPSPAQDIVALPGNAVWLDTQIFSPVPGVSGYLPYSGAIYLKRLSDGAKSNFVPFQFEPDMEQREIQYVSDYVLAQLGGVDVSIQQGEVISRYNNNWFSGVNGVDQFFVNRKLKNGWRVAQLPFAYTPQGGGVGGQAFVLPPAGLGTDSLFVIVVFSVDPWILANFGPLGNIGSGGVFDYMLDIPIEGPKGLPDGVICLQLNCP
jgi:hypothetical protein